jgi:hypothetical protein
MQWAPFETFQGRPETLSARNSWDAGAFFRFQGWKPPRFDYFTQLATDMVDFQSFQDDPTPTR